jgi:hypothetical protein
MSNHRGSIRLENDHISIEVASEFGPRITYLSDGEGANALAELDDLSIEIPGGGRYMLRGGHRLWVAPEIPEITYEPDDAPVTVTAGAQRARIVQAASPQVEIEKTVVVSLVDRTVCVEHIVTNRGANQVDIAPWGITQLPPGGFAIVPLPLEPVDRHGLQPNASIVVWPYTGTGDNPFTIGQGMIVVNTDRTDATKVGVAMCRGWLAYLRNGQVFVKRSTHRPEGRYLDMGASGQVYAGKDFTELETLGEHTMLATDQSVSHTELWELHHVEPGTPPQQIPEILDLDQR